ncbi:hypothetical protein Taro_006431 [Colocasia esculenta]|uniref:Uncharacterized protein n=1 Tax=Colocasia esculenta TaxID=4460 RepID=A0A843TR64_COLES|nr:hypothetical protein [Colocasia esculenta]
MREFYAQGQYMENEEVDKADTNYPIRYSERTQKTHICFVSAPFTTLDRGLQTEPWRAGEDVGAVPGVGGSKGN